MSRQGLFVFSLSGIPGVGKSTLERCLEANDCLKNKLTEALGTTTGVSVRFAYEPSAQWEEAGWLATFYSDTQRHAFPFQLLVFDTYVDAVNAQLDSLGTTNKEDEIVVCVTERCMWDQLLFWKLQCALTVDKNDSSSASLEDVTYMRIWNKWRSFLPNPDKIFFCATSRLEDTLVRVEARNGSDSAGLTHDYEQALLNIHREWFTTPNTSFPDTGSQIPCVHINMDASYHTDAVALDTLATKIAQEMVATIKKTSYC